MLDGDYDPFEPLSQPHPSLLALWIKCNGYIVCFRARECAMEPRPQCRPRLASTKAKIVQGSR